MSIIKSFLLLGILLAGASGVVAQEVCKRNLEPQGGFSICVPDGWTVTTKEGEKYELLFAPPGERFTTNINMKDTVSAVALGEYATASANYILKNFSQMNVKALTRDSFTTQTGLAGIKATFHAEHKGLLILSIQYYFNGNAEQKLILTCTGLQDDQVTLDPVCDRAAKTFQLEAKTPPKEE